MHVSVAMKLSLSIFSPLFKYIVLAMDTCLEVFEKVFHERGILFDTFVWGKCVLGSSVRDCSV